MLVRWNTRINLSAIRDPEEIVTRHFGESLFAAGVIFPSPASSLDQLPQVIDVGSGAGFPGLPIKIWSPRVRLTLIEANQKKATFLREVIRALKLDNAEAFAGRAESFPGQGEVVTLRAVEQFQTVLPIAVSLLKRNGKIALLIGESQVNVARQLTNRIQWHDPLPIPFSSRRVLLMGESK